MPVWKSTKFNTFEAVWNTPLQMVVLLAVEAVPLEKVLDICLHTPPLVYSWESEVESQIGPYANKIDDSQQNTQNHLGWRAESRNICRLLALNTVYSYSSLIIWVAEVRN